MLDPSGDVDKEIQHHLAEKVDLLVAAGWDRDEAFREAERSFGDIRRVRQEMSRVQEEKESASWEGVLFQNSAGRKSADPQGFAGPRTRHSRSTWRVLEPV